MSVEAMAIVLHHSRAQGTAKLVALGIANHAGDGGAWPAVSTLARYANTTPRSIQRALNKLVELGEVAVTVQGGGLPEADDFTRPNRYDLRVSCPPDCDRTPAHRTRRGGGPRLWRGPSFTPELPGSTPVDKPGDTSVTRSPSEALPPDTSVTGGGDTSVTLTTTTNPATNDLCDPGTERARGARAVGCEAGCRLEAQHDGLCDTAPAPPPTDELARIREQLARDTAATLAREKD